MTRFLIALCLATSLAFSQELPQKPAPVVAPPKFQVDAPVNTIVIGAPSIAIQPLVPVDLTFSGLTDDELPNAKLEVVPTDGAVVKSNWDWIARKPVITFWPIKPGKYTVKLTLNPVNEWRREKVNALVAIRDDKMGPELLAKYDAFAESFTKELEAQFPFKSGTAVVEVAGVPFHPTDPVDPNNPLPNNQISRVTYVWEKDLGPVPQGVVKALQRINLDSKGVIVASDFEDDTKDGTGDTPEQYKTALEYSKREGVPVLVIQSGPKILKGVKAPKTEADVMEAVK